MIKTAMILAAGRGERLKPLTDRQPKAMCRVHGIPLIEYHVVKLAQSGFQRLIINHAYLGYQIRHHLQNGSKFGIEIIYSPEPPGALETGGAIVNALPLLGSEPFLTVNADIFTDFDFKSVVMPTHSLAHLVLVRRPIYSERSDFGLSSTGELLNTDKKYTFAGIACYCPKLFLKKIPGRYSVTPLLHELATLKKASGELYEGHWMDIGTKNRLAEINA